MKFLRIVTFMTLGAVVMIALLLWVAQFFGPRDNTTPVIWLNHQQEKSAPDQQVPHLPDGDESGE